MSVLVIGQNRWGHGADLAHAKSIFRQQGGRLSDGYTIVEFPEGSSFEGVNQMGYVSYRGEPVVTEVAPRNKGSR